MKQHMQSRMLLACIALFSVISTTSAQHLTDAPNLSTATQENLSSSTASSTASTSGTSSASSASTTTAAGGGVLTDAPTIAGVGIPTMVVPWTAGAPFMQKSDLPEATVFFAVGAVLAFLGLCVIGWRVLVAWSVHRSVKRAAMASIMASETKNPGGWAGSPYKGGGGFYSQPNAGSSTSLDGHGTVRRNPAFRNPIPSNGSALFFSPTASATTTNIPMTGLAHASNRVSSLLPAGYYASPSSQVAGQPAYSDNPSIQARRSTHNLSLPQPPADRRYSARTSSLSPERVRLHPGGSASSLQVGTGHDDNLPGSRAPSAYLEDLFDNHRNQR